MKRRMVFVICTERGPLEAQSLLLVHSLRAFGGRFSQCDIYSYAPRAGRDISSRTKKALARLNVTHLHVDLNTDFTFYPFANKPLVTAHAEQSLEADVIVFVDSDMLFLSEPSELLLRDGYDIAVRPVDLKGIGVCEPHDKEYSYWQELNRVCNVEKISYTCTTVDRKKIQSYWNSGLVAVDPKKQLFSAWANNFKIVMRAGVIPQGGLIFVEQSTLAATVLGTYAKVFELPNSYNYPIHLHQRMDRSKRLENLSQIVTAHYHHMFEKSKSSKVHPLTNFLNSEPQWRWLEKHLRSTGVYKLPHMARLKLWYRRNFTERKIASVG